MTTDTPKADATRVAIECLMLYMEQDRMAALEHIAALRANPDGPGPDTIIVGLLNLSMWLGFQLAKAHGAAPDDYEQAVREILSHLSIEAMPPEQ